MKRLIYISSIFLILIYSSGCKEEDPSPFPEIEFTSISSSEVEEFDNQIEVIFSYKDVNGDLGTIDPDELTLRVKDSRLTNYDWYHVPPLTPNLEELEIEGSFGLILNPLFLLGNGDEESTVFTIQIKDRANNWSNQISTPAVIIRDSL